MHQKQNKKVIELRRSPIPVLTGPDVEQPFWRDQRISTEPNRHFLRFYERIQLNWTERRVDVVNINTIL